MKISYNWLKEYLKIELEAETLSKLLTDCGLEIESYEKYESLKGGLKGVVIGKVISKQQHPNADKLSLTSVDVGLANPLQIVCGAPNVGEGQTVAVATIGTTLYMNEQTLEIKKSKIRGIESEGMICAEDELGLGTSHAGIMVLPNELQAGMAAKDYFEIYTDTIFEIGITPNRTDALSHIGVARDIAAVLNTKENKRKFNINKPDISSFKIDNNTIPLKINVEAPEACPRYTGLVIEGIKVGESPEWLKNKLKAIGLRPINNIVDITNFVLHETGHPLHAFDYASITNNTIIVKKMPEGTPFITLDGVERKLNSDDLMICNENEAMCIAGVFGGAKSGVNENTKTVFIESAYFDAVHVRRTAKRHGLSTDASFRFERGADPNITVYAIKRAALLIKEIAGGSINSEIIDIYPSPIPDFKLKLNYKTVDSLIGYKIERDAIKTTIESLEIKIIHEDENELDLLIPPFKADVTREADVIEEILRIYGYNNIPLSGKISVSMVDKAKPDKESVKERIMDFLCSAGFNEIMSNSLSKSDYYEVNEIYRPENTVKIYNPLSKELNVLRQTLLYSGLEAIAFNQNRQINNIKVFEFGNTYHFLPELAKTEVVTKRFKESEYITLYVSGNIRESQWRFVDEKADYYYLQGMLQNILKICSLSVSSLKSEPLHNSIFEYGITYSKNNRPMIEIGKLSTPLLKKFDIDGEVFYANIEFNALLESVKSYSMQFKAIPKFPEVKRDLALLLDKEIRFEQIEELAYKQEKSLLKNVVLFDIYEGKNIPEHKKSYAVSYFLQDPNKTLTDKEIDKIMNKLMETYKRELKAEIR